MRVVVVTKDNTDYSRDVTTYLGDFRRVTGRDLEVIDPDSLRGAGFCETYDILSYPTIIALSDDGQMQHIWEGMPLPTINDIRYYTL